MRLGITSDGTRTTTTALTPQYRICEIPPIAGPNAGLFLSVAILSGLEKVDLCRVLDCCTGILIHYVGGLIVVLGQWRTAGSSQHSCIYKRDKKSDTTNITNIHFRMTRSKRHNIVTDISFSEDRSGVVIPNSKYQVFRAGMVRSSPRLTVCNLLTFLGGGGGSASPGGSQSTTMRSCPGQG